MDLHRGVRRQGRQEPHPLGLQGEDQQAEVDRVIGMGARHVDIGQTGDESWVVLADPEGNEFCILAPGD